MVRAGGVFVATAFGVLWALAGSLGCGQDGAPALAAEVDQFCQTFERGLAADLAATSASAPGLAALQYRGRPRDFVAFNLCADTRKAQRAELEALSQGFSVHCQELRRVLGESGPEDATRRERARAILERMVRDVHAVNAEVVWDR